MKKILAAGLLAIAVIAMSQQQASAWINTQFGVGVNFGWQSGDNCWLWGCWHNGPAPAASYYQPSHHGVYAAPVYVPYGHASYPMPGPVDSFAMPPSQPVYPAPTYYYYYPASYYYGR